MGERIRRKRRQRRRKSLAFVKVNVWPFARREAVVLHKSACGRRLSCSLASVCVCP